jgi:hypothetical protein
VLLGFNLAELDDHLGDFLRAVSDPSECHIRAPRVISAERSPTKRIGIADIERWKV